MKKVLGLAGYHYSQSDYPSLLWDINTAPKPLTDSIKQANMLPMIIPLGQPKDAEDYINQIDALVLSGGADVDPLLYGEEPIDKMGKIDPNRDTFEIALIKEAIKQEKAILGICRGLQILNVVFGGTIYQDLSYYPDLEINHVQKTSWEYPTHSIKIANNSILEKALEEQKTINSYHHQAVKKLADPFQAIAWSNDGLVEAFESKNSTPYILALQWHAELLLESQPKNLNIFKEFKNKAFS
ncbi:MAG: gamma-glutamyl-gamma-aminobutyrate hydrolase family protein [Atopostipes sp.]|nr:gamma-glutamyl-gamma-aminobutyrate hydrolase family protein [Atopostipes sp.]